MQENFAELRALTDWFEKEKRVFPWRSSALNPITPYKVWISEVMLQQTRAEVVIPYFQRWITRFPSIARLAEADEEEVIKAWEGLGYYARARRLLQAARYLVAHHQGELPGCPKLLAKIPGFGPYTVGAVASFAFHLKSPAVDGNVLRFLSRYLLVAEDIAKPSVQEKFRKRTLQMLPDKNPWIVMEAMIEIGAVICKKTPVCSQCPVSASCQAFHKGMTDTLPIKTPGKAITPLKREAFILKSGEKVLVGKVPDGRVMAGLFEFPWFESKDTGGDAHALFANFQQTPVFLGRLDAISYSFTQFKVALHATAWEMGASAADVVWPGYIWVPMEELSRLAFSSGHRRLCQKVLHLFAGES